MWLILHLMKYTPPEQSPSSMEVINKPKVAYTKKSLQFFFRDRRKIASAIVVLFLPVLGNVWRLIPENVPFPYYETLDIFIWNFCFHLMIPLIGVGWFMSLPSKDLAMRYISLASIAFGVLVTLDTLPFTEETPLWMDLIITALISAFLYFCLRYIQNNYLEKPDDYKVLHDGLVYDLHHQRFLGSINRIAGLTEVGEMEEPYKCLCAKEIEELKQSIAYIAEKYEALK